MVGLSNTFIKTRSTPFAQGQVIKSGGQKIETSFLLKREEAFLNHRFVAAGIGTDQVIISDDGVNWYSHTVPGIFNHPTICNDEGGNFYISNYGSSDLTILYPNCGSELAFLPYSSNWFSICHADGKFLMSDNSMTNKALFSVNGRNWSEMTLPITALWRSIIYAEGKFIFASQTGNKILMSSDLANWASSDISQGLWHCICYWNGKYILIDLGDITNGSTLASYSDDCIAWHDITLPIAAPWHYACHGDGKFVMISYGTDNVLISYDGINWIGYKLPVPATYACVRYGNGKFVAVGENSVVYSSDAINWFSANVPIQGKWYGLGYGEWS